MIRHGHTLIRQKSMEIHTLSCHGSKTVLSGTRIGLETTFRPLANVPSWTTIGAGGVRERKPNPPCLYLSNKSKTIPGITTEAACSERMSQPGVGVVVPRISRKGTVPFTKGFPAKQDIYNPQTD